MQRNVINLIYQVTLVWRQQKRKQEQLKAKVNKKKVNEGGTSEKLQKTIVIKFISEQTIGLLVAEKF